MAAGSAGVVFIDVLPNMAKFGPALDAEVTQAATGASAAAGETAAVAASAGVSKGVTKGSTGLLSSLGGMGTLIGGALVVGLTHKVFEAYDQVQKATQQLAFGFNSLGTAGAKGLVPLINWSKDFAVQTGINRADIDAMAAKMLNMGSAFFKALGPGAGAALKLVTQDMLDMSAATGKSAGMLMRSLGPAILNTPDKAVPLLQKFGVLTDEQTNKVLQLTEAGQKQAATQMILVDIQKKFGGAAAATATPLSKMKEQMNEIATAVGERLNSALAMLANVVTNIPTGILEVVTVGGSLLLVLGLLVKVGKALGVAFTENLIPAFASAATGIMKLVRASGLVSLFETLQVALMEAADGVTIFGVAVDGAVATMAPFLVALGAIAAAAAVGYGIFKLFHFIINRHRSDMLAAAKASSDYAQATAEAATSTKGLTESQMAGYEAIKGLADRTDLYGRGLTLAEFHVKQLTGLSLNQADAQAQLGKIQTDLNNQVKDGTLSYSAYADAVQRLGLKLEVTAEVAKQAAKVGKDLTTTFSQWITLTGSKIPASFKTSDDAIAFARDQWGKWASSTAQSINFVIGGISSLTSKQHISAQQIARDMDKQLKDMKRFGNNLLKISKDNTAGADALVQQLIAAGPAGQHMADVIAHATPAVRKHIESDIGQSLKDAQGTGNSLEKNLTSGFNNIAAAILVATGKAQNLTDALAQINGMHVQATVEVYAKLTGATSHHRASGGHVMAGETYTVGEFGPEPFVPDVSGTILPHSSSNGNGNRIEGSLTLTPDGRAFVRGVIVDENSQEARHAAALQRQWRTSG